ncbi:hypothetical protein NECAME_08022 [Necator americanus]|uniref:Uncharacterized protein n=1 Tax=Necator americanus TaxID=51031 RepID=W2TN01_NECAM|nr:hypothetical protein NECAME_08022 [Necator americanus]ETN82372.1 hypothetical protein NECAME_08022 [Necator americanus]
MLRYSGYLCGFAYELQSRVLPTALGSRQIMIGHYLPQDVSHDANDQTHKNHSPSTIDSQAPALLSLAGATATLPSQLTQFAFPLLKSNASRACLVQNGNLYP